VGMGSTRKGVLKGLVVGEGAGPSSYGFFLVLQPQVSHIGTPCTPSGRARK